MSDCVAPATRCSPVYLAQIDAGIAVRIGLPVVLATVFAAMAVAILAGARTSQVLVLEGSFAQNEREAPSVVLRATQDALPCLSEGRVISVSRLREWLDVRITKVAPDAADGGFIILAIPTSPIAQLDGAIKSPIRISQSLASLLLPSRWRGGIVRYTCSRA